jgi:2,4-dienoyl-CoA reductase-like NADH-dependent reductase (Old Yellow Enzyme family)
VLLTPVMGFANRIAVAPMSRVSTAGDGVATAAMAGYYAEFARGGFGLVITEGTSFDTGQAYPDQPAIDTGEQVRAWAQVVDAVHDAGGKIFLQLMHAGALVQTGRTGVAPSAVQPLGRMLRGYGGAGPYPLPRELTTAEIDAIVAAFAAAAVRARDAGFDGVEVHAANGYLLDQFLTTYTNRRTDGYGTERAKIVVEVLQAIEALPAGLRISQLKVNDRHYRWEDPAALFEALAPGRPAYVHVASEGGTWAETSLQADGDSLTALARRTFGVPVIANGGLDDAPLAERVLADGHADLVSLGHGALANPDWPRRLAAGAPFEPFDPGLLRPEVTIENAQRARLAA